MAGVLGISVGQKQQASGRSPSVVAQVPRNPDSVTYRHQTGVGGQKVAESTDFGSAASR